jgi:hypothetical protein
MSLWVSQCNASLHAWIYSAKNFINTWPFISFQLLNSNVNLKRTMLKC